MDHAVVRAAVLLAPRQIEIREFPRPGIGHTFGLDDSGYALDVLAGDVPGEEAVHVTIAPNGAAQLARPRTERVSVSA
jgi:hypothetical protein